jgi:hypothetical protein
MPSDYQGITVTFETEPGVLANPGAGVDVIIYDVDTATDLDTVTTDSNGQILAGTVSVAAGSHIRFRVENFQGMAFSVDQITT